MDQTRIAQERYVSLARLRDFFWVRSDSKPWESPDFPEIELREIWIFIPHM